jgi:UDPglucose 6-dehydrogenase
MGYDRRIGSEFLRPGPGWGGSCFPKDSRALVSIAENAGYDFDLLKGVITVNEEQFDRVAEKAVDIVGGSADGVTLAVWGLTFKARTDDLRESPALAVIDRLHRAGARIRAYDPSMPDGIANVRQAHLVERLDLVTDPYAACEGAAALLVLTEWDEFRWLDFDKVAATLAAKRVVDARNLLDREALRRRGFVYTGVGRI